ncbi:Glycosylphosphatidylinositol specific phospholipase D1, partial [Cladochytrium tenue]
MGAVFILYSVSTSWKPSLASIESIADVTILGDIAEDGSRFGSSLTVVDIDQDGIDDLVAAAPQYNSVDLFYDGRVYLFRGSRETGLQAKLPENVTLYPEREGQLIGDAPNSASVILEAPQRAPNHAPGESYAFLFTGLGAHLSAADLNADGFADLIIGCPFMDTGTPSRKEQQRGVVYGIISSADRFGTSGQQQPGSLRDHVGPLSLNVSDAAAWSMDSGDLGNYQWFGRSVAFVPANGTESSGLLLVGAPGWRSPGEDSSASGRVYGYEVPPSGQRPLLRFSLTSESTPSSFGSLLSAGTFDASGRVLVAVASPSQTSNMARAKFMDLPSLLTSPSSKGYAAGAVTIFDPRQVPSGDLTVARLVKDVMYEAIILGSRSNGRLGGGAWAVSDSMIWIGEPLVDGANLINNASALNPQAPMEHFPPLPPDHHLRPDSGAPPPPRPASSEPPSTPPPLPTPASPLQGTQTLLPPPPHVRVSRSRSVSSNSPFVTFGSPAAGAAGSAAAAAARRTPSPSRGFGADYDSIAEVYDVVYEDWPRAIAKQSADLHAIIAAHVSAAALDSPIHVLDASCGIGTQLIGLAGLGYKLVGCDVSAGAVSRCREEVARRGLADTVEALLALDMRAVGPGRFRALLDRPTREEARAAAELRQRQQQQKLRRATQEGKAAEAAASGTPAARNDDEAASLLGSKLASLVPRTVAVAGQRISRGLGFGPSPSFAAGGATVANMPPTTVPAAAAASIPAADSSVAASSAGAGHTADSLSGEAGLPRRLGAVSRDRPFHVVMTADNSLPHL